VIGAFVAWSGMGGAFRLRNRAIFCRECEEILAQKAGRLRRLAEQVGVDTRTE
jgi:hypothetical protein